MHAIESLLAAPDSAQAIGKGRVTLVNFWGLACSACLEEMPYLVALTMAAALLAQGAQVRALRYENEEADLLNRLVHNLLEMTRLEAGAQALELRRGDDRRDEFGVAAHFTRERVACRCCRRR